MNRALAAFAFAFGLSWLPSQAYAGGPVNIPFAQVAPVIDGDMSDAAWSHAAIFRDFKTMKPDFGHPPSERTEVFVTLDHQYLYVAIRAFDDEPGKIKATIARRDSVLNDDWVAFCLDAADDNLTAYVFGANPRGIQMDGTLDSSAEFDAQFDAVWKSAGRVLADGYVVEMAIPFKSLRYAGGQSVRMGFKVARYISRKSEEVDFPEFSPNRGAALAQFQKVEMSGIGAQPLREVVPAFTFGSLSTRRNGRLGKSDDQENLGLSAKVAVTPELVLEGTVHPDFSQVEADAEQLDVNLRSSLFYAEKRPFFMEGNDSFGFAARSDASPLGAVVNTRTIVDPSVGVKFGGRIGSRNRIATLFASDRYPGELSDGGDAGGPSARLSILRYARSLQQDSYVGGFVVNRDFAGTYNRVAGSDGRVRLGGRSVFEYHAFASNTRGREAERPVAGSAVAAMYRYGSPRVWFTAGVDDVSRDFHVDAGYLTRSGITRFPVKAGYTVQVRSRWLQKVEPFYSGAPSRDRFSGLFENRNVFGANLFFTRQTVITMGTVLGSEVYSAHRFDRDAVTVEGRSQLWKQLNLEFSYQNGQMVYYSANPFQGKGTQASIGLLLQPTARLSTTFQFSHADFSRATDDAKVYEYAIWRNRTVMQVNRYLFLREIVEYNTYWKRLNVDVLGSFTYVPGTAVYVGYGSVYEKTAENQPGAMAPPEFLKTKSSFFLKASYLWRF